MPQAKTSQPANSQTVAELLARARTALGHRADYVLGGGAATPDAPSPLDELGTCDCSGFVCWALRTPRQQPTGQWLNTDAMWWDAIGGHSGLFARLDLDAPRPGALLVYPSLTLARRHVKPVPPRGPKVGHVAIVVAFEPKLRIIHCSAGNERHGDAIAETDDSVFRAVPYRAAVWFSGIDTAARDQGGA